VCPFVRRAALRKLRLNAEKYPADRARGSSAKYTAYFGEEDAPPSPSGEDGAGLVRPPPTPWPWAGSPPPPPRCWTPHSCLLGAPPPLLEALLKTWRGNPGHRGADGGGVGGEQGGGDWRKVPAPRPKKRGAGDGWVKTRA